MTGKPVQSGEWYFGTDCRFCGQFIPMFLDKSQGQTPIQFDGPGVLRTECPHCGEEGHYAAVQMTSRPTR